MIETNDILLFLREMKPELREQFGIHTIGLFGSFARKQQNSDSDIDLLVEFDPGTDELFEKKEKLRELISDRFNVDVDICRLKYLKSYYAKTILDTVIYA